MSTKAQDFLSHVNTHQELNWDDTDMIDAAQRFGIEKTEYIGPRCVLKFKDGSRTTWIYHKTGIQVISINDSGHFVAGKTYECRPPCHLESKTGYRAKYSGDGMGIWIDDTPFGMKGEQAIMGSKDQWPTVVEAESLN